MCWFGSLKGWPPRKPRKVEDCDELAWSLRDARSMQEKHAPSSPRSPNKILASLPRSEYRRLLSVLYPISLLFQQVLLKPNEPLRTIYFPGGGACSITQIMRNGRTVEVATVGNEGFIGLNALLGGDRSRAGAVVTVADGAAQAMSVSAFQREMNRRGPFSRLINSYAEVFVTFLMRSVACNALHSVDERCARWLLTTRDRVGRNEFPLTQEFLAGMLGVRRPTVTLTVSALQRAGLIDYGHRRIIILDRAGLESASCECYCVLKRQFARLLP
jgi:CRP-like cAMP-binding protein